MEANLQPRVLQLAIQESEIPQFLTELHQSKRPYLQEIATSLANKYGYTLAKPEPEV
jgi:hypothetical protein